MFDKKEYDRVRYLRLREKILVVHKSVSGRARRQKWEDENRKNINTKTTAWRHAHPEAAHAAVQKWMKIHAKAYYKKWNADNPQRLKVYRSRWGAKNPSSIKSMRHRRRARKMSAAGNTSAAQLQARVDFYGNRCAYCSGSYEAVDHVIPLSRGGSNWPANLRPACKRCNSSKRAKKLSEWKMVG